MIQDEIDMVMADPGYKSYSLKQLSALVRLGDEAQRQKSLREYKQGPSVDHGDSGAQIV